METEVITSVTATIAVLGFLVALASFLHDNKNDAKDEAKSDGRVLARLDSIDNGIRDIKAENRSMRKDMQEIRDIAQHANDRAESAHHRLDRAGIDIHTD